MPLVKFLRTCGKFKRGTVHFLFVGTLKNIAKNSNLAEEDWPELVEIEAEGIEARRMARDRGLIERAG